QCNVVVGSSDARTAIGEDFLFLVDAARCQQVINHVFGLNLALFGQKVRSNQRLCTGDVTVDEGVRSAAVDHHCVRCVHPRLDVCLIDAHVELVRELELASGNLNRTGFQFTVEGCNPTIENMDVLETCIFERNEGTARQRVVVVDEQRVAVFQTGFGDDLLDHVVWLELVADTIALGNIELRPWQVDGTGDVTLLEGSLWTDVNDLGALLSKLGKLVSSDDDREAGFLRNSGNAEHGVLSAGADCRYGNSERKNRKRTCCKKTTGGHTTHWGTPENIDGQNVPELSVPDNERASKACRAKRIVFPDNLR